MQKINILGALVLLGGMLSFGVGKEASAQSCPLRYTGTVKSDCNSGNGAYYGGYRQFIGAPGPRPLINYGNGTICWATQDLPGHCAEPAQPLDPSHRNVYRFYYRTSSGNVSDHFSAIDYEAGGWLWGTYENVRYKILKHQIDSNTVPLYTCYGSWGDHFLETNASCGGHTYQGMFGYISKVPRAGYVPLYRFVRLAPWDFIETTNWDEVVNWQQAGYTILGYVPE